MPRFFNPFTDFGFKKLFGEEANKDLLIDFLNAFLPTKHRIADLTFRNSEQLPENILDRKAIFDISCVGENGAIFTVEMQKAKQHYFKDRALFYLSYPIQRQAQKGDWDFKLNPIFLVAVLDFEYDEHEERRKIHRHVVLKDQDGDVFSESLQMVFLQMPLFDLQESDLKTTKDKWLFFLKNLESFEDIPAVLQEPVFTKAFEIAEYTRFAPDVQEVYQNNLKIYRDNQAVVKTAMLDGYDVGKKDGKLEGFFEGVSKRNIELVRNMNAKGLSVGLISDITGISVIDIEALINNQDG